MTDPKLNGPALNGLAASATLHCLTGCALGVVLAADTLSIAVMEVVDNAVMVGVPGAIDAGLNSWVFWASLAFSLAVAFVVTVPGAMEPGRASWLFWGSLAFALAVAFVVTVPINRALIRRGRGHAVVHAHHTA